MNILILADGDWSGAGYALFEAINQHTDHTARQVAYQRNYLDYDCDVFKPTDAELRELIEWADVVNIHDGNDWLIPSGAPHKLSFVTYHGSQYRARWPHYNVLDRGRQRISTALNLDLVMLGPRWLPRPIPNLGTKHKRSNNGVFRVAHAPTNRGVKDTETVIGALDALDGVELVLIEGVSNAECIQRKAECDLLVEEFQLGYGTNALENWAMGIPVIAHALPGILAYMKRELGELPFVDTPLENLRETVTMLRDDRKAYSDAKRKGRRYWRKYHAPKVVAKRFIEICEETIDATIND
jgi:glycosyltransferase involved in cell wall biosynthesis